MKPPESVPLLEWWGSLVALLAPLPNRERARLLSIMAQYTHSLGVGDIHGLDGDDDGSACESLP